MKAHDHKVKKEFKLTNAWKNVDKLNMKYS